VAAQPEKLAQFVRCKIATGGSGAWPGIETADGAGKNHFKRFPANISYREGVAEIRGYNHYQAAIRLRLSAPDKWPMLQ
jgi:hypothetical protein